MPRITSSDPGLGVCSHAIEAVEEEELRRLARERALEVHDAEVDDERLAAATRPT
jgi:hypothetical protein